MQKNPWLHAALALSLLQVLALNIHAQDPMPGTPGSASAMHSRVARGGFGFEGRLGKAVGLSTEQRETVHGLLAEQRQQRTAIQEQTDAKIRALLNPEQQKKFDAFLNQQKQERAARTRKPS